jgi:hypothetical protein
VAEGKFAELKLDAGVVREKIRDSPGILRQSTGEEGIALAVVAPQNIFGIKGCAIFDVQLTLPAASGGANALGRKRCPAAGLIRFLEQQHPRALLGCHKRGHEPASAGADDDDVGIYVLHGASENRLE